MKSEVTTPRRRRWFRFSLRTFFVVVVLLGICCAWVAREAAIVRERKAILEWCDGKPGAIDPNTIYAHEKIANWGPWGYSDDRHRAAWWRRLLNDVDGPKFFYHVPHAQEFEIERVRAAFPEATVEPWPE